MGITSNLATAAPERENTATFIEYTYNYAWKRHVMQLQGGALSNK